MFRPFKPAILTRIPSFESIAGSRVNTPLVAVTNMGWRVYTQVFLRQKALPSMNEFTLLWIFA